MILDCRTPWYASFIGARPLLTILAALIYLNRLFGILGAI